jgi:hypothetical protein
MTRQIGLIIFCLTILAFGLAFGSPIEIMTQPGHRIATLITGLLIGIIIYISLRQAFGLKNKTVKIIGLGLVGLLTVVYLYIGLWTIPQAIYSSKYPMWKDVTIYSNDKGEKVIGQFMEISGSLYAYQSRKVFGDFGNGVRISLYWCQFKPEGIWREEKIKDTATNK